MTNTAALKRIWFLAGLFLVLAFSANQISVANADTVAPTVSIEAPSHGDVVSGALVLQVQADDNEDGPGTLSVQVSIDGGAFSPTAYNATSGKYELLWNTIPLSDGSHTVDARATDGAGNTAIANQVTVTVDNPKPVGGTTSYLVDGSGSSTGSIALLAGGIAIAVAVGAAAGWYARRG